MADLVYPGETSGGPIAVLPGNYDITIYRGDALEFYVQIKDQLGVAVDISAATVSAQLKANYDDPQPVSFNCTKPGATGLIRVFMSSSVTKDLLGTSYIWDLQLTTAGENKTYLAGDVTVIRDVTQ